MTLGGSSDATISCAHYRQIIYGQCQFHEPRGPRPEKCCFLFAKSTGPKILSKSTGPGAIAPPVPPKTSTVWNIPIGIAL